MGMVRITVKISSGIYNGVKIEKGMSIDISSPYPNPVTVNGGREVNEAFIKKHGVDLIKAGKMSMPYLETQKIS